MRPYQFANPSLVRTVLLLLSNDVEQNPGPVSMAHLERGLAEVTREVQRLEKALAQQVLHSENLLRGQQRSRQDEVVSQLNCEVFQLRECLENQRQMTKRQQAEQAVLAHELGSLKRLHQSLNADLQLVSADTVTELKELQRELRSSLRQLQREKQVNDSAKSQMKEAALSISRHHDRQKADLLAVRDELQALQRAYQTQVQKVDDALNSILVQVEDNANASREARERAESCLQQCQGFHRSLKEDARLLSEDNRCNKAAINEAASAINDLREEFKDHKSSEGEFRQVTKKELKRLQKLDDHLEKQLCQGLGKLEASQKSLTQSVENAYNKHKDDLNDIRTDLKTFKEAVQADRINSNEDPTSDSPNGVSSSPLNTVQGQLDQLKTDMKEVLAQVSRSLEEESSRSQSLIERVNELDSLYDDMQERVFEIDKNRKNNLILYGVHGLEQDDDDCELKVKQILAGFFQVSREMPLTKVTRIWNGPSVQGIQPILVCFQLFRDREEVLRKAHLLRGTHLYVTEDFSRKIRRHREELIKFAKERRNKQPEVKCVLQYDRLYVGHEAYLYNEVESKVQKVIMKTEAEGWCSSRRRRDQGLSAEAFNGSPLPEFPSTPDQSNKLLPRRPKTSPGMAISYNLVVPTNQASAEGISSPDEDPEGIIQVQLWGSRQNVSDSGVQAQLDIIIEGRDGKREAIPSSTRSICLIPRQPQEHTEKREGH